ncbi:MAG: 16S rRNA (cytosine(967)-C(5))-methyltransferase RsmB [Clostridia bacterium]|jgi:16S rRNA (cytosine967-C5)-methyltransferase
MALDKTRETALKILYDIDEFGAYSNISMSKHFNNNELKDLDKAFITGLVNGTVKWRLSIDSLIEQYSTIKIKKMSGFILNILRLGIYQLIYMHKIPKSAAVDESVKLAKRYGNKGSVGFVNAVLRSVSKNIDNIKYPSREDGVVKYLSVKYSHPEWLVNEWLEEFGEEFAEGILASNNDIPDLCIRVNTLKTTKEDLFKMLRDIGIEATMSNYIDEALVICEASNIFRSELFKDGFFQVQDESAMLVSKVLNPKEGELVVDVCSAPGGKATHIAQLMNDKGTVIARDKHLHKIKLIEELSKKLGITIIKAELFDAEATDEKLINKADKVIVDAPCTGFGILRRKPDIKWTRKLPDIEEIAKAQKKILQSASSYVKPGGVLLYSTCTLGRKENENVISEFLVNNKEFETVDITGLLPNKLKKEVKNNMIQLFPNRDKTDGFFIAKMQRVR